MQKGVKNEFDFVKYINNVLVRDLNFELKKLLYSIFNNINENDRIICWKSLYNEKADIKIKINKEIRGISIKTGKYCSMHQENIKTFYPFLTRIGVDNYIIDIFDEFKQGYYEGKKVDSKKYIENNLKSIEILRESFDNFYTKLNLIIRFLIQGTENQLYGYDAIIHGTPKNFMWATKEEVVKYLLEYKVLKYNYINISALNIKIYDRNLRNSKEKKSKENDIQIKWYTIEDDLKKIQKSRSNLIK